MKEVKLKLDDKSVEILGEIDPIHITSVINFGIRLAKDTSYFKILKGEENVEVEELIAEKDTPKKSKNEEVKEEVVEEDNDIMDISGW